MRFFKDQYEYYDNSFPRLSLHKDEEQIVADDKEVEILIKNIFDSINEKG